MSSIDIRDLFIEVVSFMGIRGYDISPFMFLINNKMKNERHLQLGELDKIEEISVESIISFLEEYRYYNFSFQPGTFNEQKTAFTVPFNHTFNGMTTLVFFTGDESKSLTSKDKINSFITGHLITLVLNKTNGISHDVWNPANKVSAIFILAEGVSSYSKTFLDELDKIEIITESEIMSRCYDSCLQSNVRTISEYEKKILLSEVGLSSSNIPAVTKRNDILCKILGFKQGELMISYRRNIASEETVTDAVFLRNIN